MLMLLLQAKAIYGTTAFDYQIQKTLKLISRQKSIQEITKKNHPLNDFVDNIYLVNLKRHEQRLARAAFNLQRQGISFSLHEGVDGYCSPKANLLFQRYSAQPLGSMSYFKEFNQFELDHGAHLIESKGTVGYLLTFANILRDAIQNKYSSILILEDDVFLTNPQRISTFLSCLPPENLSARCFSVLWTSIDLDNAKDMGFYYPRIIDTCGSFAIGIKTVFLMNSLHCQLMNHLLIYFVSYRKYLGECFVGYPALAIPDVSESSIRHGRDQIKHSEL